MKKSLLVLMFFGSSVGQLFAQTCCSGGVPLSGNLGLPASDKGVWQASVSYDLNKLNTLKTGTEKLNDDSRNRLTRSVLLELGYSITNRISVDGFFSWVRQEREITQFGNRDFLHTDGIGDAVVLLKYKFTPFADKNDVVQVGIGPKIPLGASDQRRENGITLNADLQPGSGAWDLVFWANSIKNTDFRPSMSVSTTLTYGLKGENDEYLGSSTYKFGNEFQAALGVADRVNISSLIVDPSIAFKFRKVSQDEFNFNDVPSTGGQWIFISPGLSFPIASTSVINVTGDLPIFSDITGTQVTPTYRLNVGVLFVFKKKSTAEQKFEL